MTCWTRSEAIFCGDTIPQNAVSTLNWRSTLHCIPERKYSCIHEPGGRNRNLPTIIPNDPVEDFELSINTTLGSVGFELPVLKEAYSHQEIQQLTYILWLPPEHFGNLKSRKQQAKIRVIILSEANDPYQ